MKHEYAVSFELFVPTDTINRAGLEEYLTTIFRGELNQRIYNSVLGASALPQEREQKPTQKLDVTIENVSVEYVGEVG
jgi:hypothetical protein